MTTPFRPISSASSAAVPQRCDMTLYLGDGRRYHMRVEHPMVKVERESRYDDIYAFGDPASVRYAPPDEVTVTIEGRLGDARDMVIGSRAPTPRPAQTWSEKSSDPVADVKTWANRMRDEATAPTETAVRSLDDLPQIGDLVKEIGDAQQP
jgi:hypothetical protein